MSDTIPEREWKWFGYPGHFIAANSCRFRLCTQVGGYLISTVGDYWVRLRGEETRETIGAGKKDFFETYVFEAGMPCMHADCGCGQPSISGSDIDGERTATAGEAQAKHYEFCRKYAAIAATIEQVTP